MIVARLNEQLQLEKARQRVLLEEQSRELADKERRKAELMELQQKLVAAASPYNKRRRSSQRPFSASPARFTGRSPSPVGRVRPSITELTEDRVKEIQAREARRRALERARQIMLQKEAQHQQRLQQLQQEQERRAAILALQQEHRRAMRTSPRVSAFPSVGTVSSGSRAASPAPGTASASSSKEAKESKTAHSDFDERLQSRYHEIIKRMRMERDLREQEKREQAERVKRARDMRPQLQPKPAAAPRPDAEAQAKAAAALRRSMELRKFGAAHVIQRAWKCYKRRKQIAAELKQRKQRRTVAVELLETEKKYVEDLKLVRELFIAPLRGKSFMKEADIRAVFGNLEELIKLNELILEELKQNITSSSSVRMRVGDIFLRTAPFLKSYMPYCSNYQSALQALSKLQRKNDKFNAVVKTAQENPRCNGLTLVSFLITPVQRIPRYELLLRELLKATHPTIPDHDDVVKALAKIKEIAAFVNEGIRSMERMSKVLQVQNQVSHFPEASLVQPSRLYVREGVFVEKLPKEDPHSVYLFLFNDVLLCTVKTRFAFSEYKYKYMLSLKDMTVTQANDDHIDNAFCLQTEKETIIFGAETPEQKLEWLADLQQYIQVARRRIVGYSPQSMRYSVPPASVQHASV